MNSDPQLSLNIDHSAISENEFSYIRSAGGVEITHPDINLSTNHENVIASALGKLAEDEKKAFLTSLQAIGEQVVELSHVLKSKMFFSTDNSYFRGDYLGQAKGLAAGANAVLNYFGKVVFESNTENPAQGKLF